MHRVQPRTRGPSAHKAAWNVAAVTIVMFQPVNSGADLLHACRLEARTRCAPSSERSTRQTGKAAGDQQGTIPHCGRKITSQRRSPRSRRRLAARAGHWGPFWEASGGTSRLSVDYGSLYPLTMFGLLVFGYNQATQRSASATSDLRLWRQAPAGALLATSCSLEGEERVARPDYGRGSGCPRRWRAG